MAEDEEDLSKEDLGQDLKELLLKFLHKFHLKLPQLISNQVV